MAVTRLKRKGAKNKSRAKNRVETISRLNRTPVIKNVDVEAIKEEWAKEKKGGKTTKKAAKTEEAPVEEAPKAEATEEKGE